MFRSEVSVARLASPFYTGRPVAPIGIISPYLEDSRLGCVDRIVRKEYNEGAKPLLHLYGVFKSELSGTELALDASLKEKDSFYRDLQQMLDIFPLRVTRLAPDAFEGYYD